MVCCINKDLRMVAIHPIGYIEMFACDQVMKTVMRMMWPHPGKGGGLRGQLMGMTKMRRCAIISCEICRLYYWAVS